MNTPLINGKRHSWADIRVNLFGRTVTGISAIMYKSKKTKENIYGAGSLPVARGHGNKEFEASITLQKYEVDAIKRSLGDPTKDLTDIPMFDIPVVYRSDNGEIVTDLLQNVEFVEDANDFKQGDTGLECVCPLIIAGIKQV